MPKIIDRENHKTMLAAKAAVIFSEKGYSGLGMREIAQSLGMSKSALYHYFASKEELFTACTEYITHQTTEMLFENIDKLATREQKIKALIDTSMEMEDFFVAELYLLFDYLRGRQPEDIAQDPNMNLSNERFTRSIFDALQLDKSTSKAVWCLLMGGMLQRYFDGRCTSFAQIGQWIGMLIDNKKDT